MTTPDPFFRRTASDLLCLWALCGKPACRRARSCKRDPRACARRYGPLVPEEARLGMLAFMQGMQDGVSADVVRAHVPAETAALDAWTDRIEAAVCGGQARETVDHGPP